MPQSSVIAASLVIAFVIFVINRGELPCYLQLLGIATQANCPKGQAVAPVGTTSTTFPQTSSVSKLGVSLNPSGGGGVTIGVGGINIGIGGGAGGF